MIWFDLIWVLWHQIVLLWHQVTMVASEQHLYQTIVLPRKPTTMKTYNHDYLFRYYSLVGILFQVLRIACLFQGASVGSIVGFVFACWIAFGSYLTKQHLESLPSPTYNCSVDESNVHHLQTWLDGATSTTTSLAVWNIAHTTHANTP